jgi:DNA repair exonuclease SbcCD ATPase subunit
MTENVTPPSREAEIAARLAKLKADRERYRGEFGDSSVAQYDGHMEADLRYLLAQLQQARQENERLTAEIAQDLTDYREVSRTALSAIGEVEQERDAALQQAREALTVTHEWLENFGEHQGTCRDLPANETCVCELDACIEAIDAALKAGR